RAERRARMVVDDDLARQVHPAAGLADALVQVRVLVGERARVVHADLLEDATPERAEEDGVDEALLHRGAVARAADAERALERGAERLREPRLAPRPLRAADVVGAGALEDLHAATDVVGRVLAVDVHAHDDVAARLPDRLVHARRLQPRRIVDE